MQIEKQELEHRVERLIQGLRQAGIKVTPQRLEVFRQLAGSGDHPDAEAVHKAVRRKMPTVSLDTVYRTLWLLVDLGLVTTLGPGRERTRFDANLTPHHHFVCTKCGLTRDFYSREFDSLRTPPELARLGKVEKVQVQARGICRRCRQMENGDGNNPDKGALP